MHGVLDTKSNSKTHPCDSELSLSPMISICQIKTLIYRLSVQKGTLYKMLNSEFVYPACLRPNTLKTKPCSATHHGWSQTREYPMAKFMAFQFLPSEFFFTMSSVFCQNILTIPPQLPPPPHLLWYTSHNVWHLIKHTGANLLPSRRGPWEKIAR